MLRLQTTYLLNYYALLGLGVGFGQGDVHTYTQTHTHREKVPLSFVD